VQAGDGSLAFFWRRQTAGAGSPSCKTCHGAQGEGTVAAPRLAGQSDLYLSRQLGAFSMATRFHPVMGKPTRTLIPKEIRAIVAYVGGG
jgi:cytochrome c553